MALSIYTVIFCVVLLTILYHWNMIKLRKYTKYMSGPTPLPFFGSSLGFLGSNRDIYAKLKHFVDNYRDGTKAIKVWLGNFLVIVLVTPEAAKVVLNSPHCQKKSVIYKVFTILGGQGTFTCNEIEKMKMHRKAITSTMSPAALKSYVSVWARHSKILSDKLSTQVGKPIFDVLSFNQLYRMQVTGETLLGTILTDEEELNKIQAYMDWGMARGIKRAFKPWLYEDSMFKLTSVGALAWKRAKEVREFARKMAMAKIKEYNDKSGFWGGEGYKFKSALDSLVELYAQGIIPVEQIVDEIITAIAGAVDAPSLEDSYILMMLGMHQDIQEEIYREIRDLYGDSDRPCVPEDLHQMNLLERAIKETMRLFPVVPLNARYTEEDIDVGSYVLPKYTNVAIYSLELHRNPDVWEDPLRFDPDRFLPERYAKLHPYSFLALSGGPRNCPGPKYGMMSMMVNISTILRKFKVFTPNKKTVGDINLKYEFMLKNVDGFKIRLEHR